MRHLPLILLAVALSFDAAGLAAQGGRDIRGHVRAAADSSAIAGVRVTVVGGNRMAVTGRDGGFTLRAVPRGLTTLALLGGGIVPDTVAMPLGRDTITIYVRRLSIALPAVVIRGERQPVARERFESTAQLSTASLAPAEITRAPGLFEADVVRVVQLLPGSVTKNDYTIGYNVRGGEADQNLVQLDGIPVFNPSHLAGLFSTFDANAVASTDFYVGGFPAAYPGRLSSVLDVRLRSGDPDAVRWHGQVSLLSSKLLVEGPVGPATFLAAARRTYADAVVSLLTSEVLPYYFTDAVGRVTLPYGRRGAVAVTGYWGRDVLDLELVQPDVDRDGVRLAFDWGNRLAGVTWRHPVGRRGLVDTRVGLSEFSTTLGLTPSLVRFDNRARLYTAQVLVAPAPGTRHDIQVGAGVESYAMDYAVESFALETSFFRARYRPTVWSAFLEDEWRAARGLLLRPGVRVEHVTGAGTTALSPRLSVKLFLDARTAAIGSVGRYHQAIHSIRDQELPVTVYEFWIGADRFVPVARADHLVLGFERWLREDLQLSLEGYRKTFANLVTPNRAQDLRLEGDEFLPVSGDAWGLDLLLRKHLGALRGWIAYGFTKASRRALGTTYPPAHDRRHTLNVVAFLPGPLGSDLGIRWGLGSPLPYTGFVGEWDHRFYSATEGHWVDFDTEPISAAINGERYPPYSRLDVSMRWDFTGWGVRWEPYVQIANVYNRRNVFLYFFDYLDSPPTRTGVSQIPLLPTFGVELSF